MDDIKISEYREKGHATVPAVFSAAEMDAAIVDIERWGEEFLRELPAAQRRWYLDGGVLHQSGPNHSLRWRRACALHYVRSDNAFVQPGLPYDESMFLRIT